MTNHLVKQITTNIDNPYAYKFTEKWNEREMEYQSSDMLIQIVEMIWLENYMIKGYERMCLI